MKKLRSFALYALVTPTIAFGTGTLLADENIDKDVDREQLSTQSDQDSALSSTDPDKIDKDVDREQLNTQSDQDGTLSSTDPDKIDKDVDREQLSTQSDQNTGDQARMQNRGYMDSAPPNGMQVSDLIGAEVKTNNDENVGSVSDLIVDENGQIVAIVVGAGGFLGMGERDIAIGWDDVTRSGDSDDQELRIDATREDLGAAPKFERRD